MPKHSVVSDHFQGQRMFQILARARGMERAGINVIHLEIGDPDFSTPRHIISAAKNALDAGDTHYCESVGLVEFRETAALMTHRSRGFRPAIDQILVTPGANIQLYLAMVCACNPGDEIIVQDPSFVSYLSIASLCGLKVVPVPLLEENAFRLRASDVAAAVTAKTKMIIINSPHNPTGAVMSREDVRAIYDVACAHDLWLLSDEVYGRMSYGPEFFSPSSIDKCLERTILVHSFSKSYAMTGWRIGAVTAPADLITKMALLLETVTSCTPPFVQKAAIEAMKNDQDEIASMIATYRRRRDLIVERLNGVRGIKCLLPDGAFYAFANIRDTELTSEAFAEVLLEKAGVAACPGNFFGQAGEGYVRFCFANSEENIEEALRRVANLFGRRT